MRQATPTDRRRIEAETGRDYTGPYVLIAERGGERVGLIAVRDRPDLIEACRFEADTPWIGLRLVEAFERDLVSLGIDRYRFTAERGRMDDIASKMVDRGGVYRIGQQGRYTFYERIIDNAT